MVCKLIVLLYVIRLISMVWAFIQRRLGVAILLRCLAETGEHAPMAKNQLQLVICPAANDHGMMFTKGVPTFRQSITEIPLRKSLVNGRCHFTC